jgi:hypothetical protein
MVPKSTKGKKKDNSTLKDRRNGDCGDNDDLNVLTDSEITRLSQAKADRQRLEEQYKADTAFIQQWVANLPNPTGFRIPNVDAIIQRHFG